MKRKTKAYPLICMVMVIVVVLALDLSHARLSAASGPVFGVESATYDPGVPGSTTYFIINTQPGQTIQQSVRVTNTGDTAGDVHLYPVDAATGSTSGIVYLGASDPRTDVGSWATVDGTPITLNPGESRVVAVTITVPASPRSGQHVGGIVAEPVQSGTGSTITLTARAAMQVLMNLPPPLTDHMAIPSISPGYNQAFPSLLLGLRNDGTTLVAPSGSLMIKDAFGHTALQVPLSLDTFVPQTQIAYPISLQTGQLPLGDYTATIALSYGTNGTTTQTLSLAYYYGPTLTGITPSSGFTTGETTVTLTGFGFGTTADTQVLIDGAMLPTARVQSVAARSIRFTVPPHAVGAVTVTVSVGGTIASGSVRYQYGMISQGPPAPKPTGVVQGSGPAPPVPVLHATAAPQGHAGSQPTRH